MMGDGKALQMGTSHELGQNFARAFDIQLSDEPAPSSSSGRRRGGQAPGSSARWSWRHGDDFGLRLPPALAPSQVVVMVVKEDEATVRAAAEALVPTCAAGTGCASTTGPRPASVAVRSTGS
jgi:prolyl-tRNA synthetase